MLVCQRVMPGNVRLSIFIHIFLNESTLKLAKVACLSLVPHSIFDLTIRNDKDMHLSLDWTASHHPSTDANLENYLENLVPLVLGIFQSARSFGHWKRVAV